MLVNFISNQHCNKLRNPGKYQIGVQSFFVLGFTPCNAKAVLEVVDGFLHIHTYLVSGVPFFGATDCSRVSAEILFRIHVDHSTTGRRCTGIVAVADTFGFFGCFVVFPFHFRADKLHGGNPAAQVRFAAFPFH